MRIKENWFFLMSSMISMIYLSQFFGCASIQHPTGGPKDSIGPKVLEERPKNMTTNFKGEEVEIEFDEFFKIQNEFKEVSFSPAMEKTPVLKVRKKTLHIQFLEPLQDSTTYTINYGNAIVDYNAGNVLKNYMTVFSTGPVIDSLNVSGTVLDRLTKEPVLDATVMLFPISQDTSFGKRRAALFTSTDSSGNFNLKYLRANTYTLYALKEENGDKIFNSTKEAVAFYSKPIALTKDTSAFNLELFYEEPKVFRILDRKIEKDGRLTFIFNKQLQKPSIRLLGTPELDASKLVEFNKTNDTAFVWTQNMDFDSLNVAINDDKSALDTIVLRRSKRDTYNRALTVTSNVTGNVLKPGTDLILTLSAPLKTIDGKKFSLLQDSVAITGLRVSRDSLSSRKLILRYPWKQEKKYSLNIAEGAFSSTFGAGTSKLFSVEFTRDPEENYGELTTLVTVPDTARNYIIQLLDDQLQVVSSNVIRKNSRLNFPMMSVGKYLIRVIYDNNNNKKWDTGNVSEKRQPEQVWNFPKEITLRANFEIEEAITIPKDQ